MGKPRFSVVYIHAYIRSLDFAVLVSVDVDVQCAPPLHDNDVTVIMRVGRVLSAASWRLNPKLKLDKEGRADKRHSP